MPTSVDKQATVDLLRHEYAAIAALVATLSPDQWDIPTCLPGWSVRDVLAHVIGTESMMAGDEPPSADTSHLHHMQNPIAEANEVWVESMRPLSGAQMRSRFDEVTGRRLEALDAMTQEDFDAPSWTPAGKDETYGRFMRIRHYDCFMHEHDIGAAVGVPPRDEAADLVSALSEVETGLGYIVGRRAGFPDGSSVRIELTGAVTRTYLVAVDGRATVVESLDGPATVTMALPVTRFLRLTGGRHDDPPFGGPDAVISGDLQLGAQLIDNLAFTI